MAVLHIAAEVPLLIEVRSLAELVVPAVGHASTGYCLGYPYAPILYVIARVYYSRVTVEKMIVDSTSSRSILESMRVTLCGSIQFEQNMAEAADTLKALGYDTERPISAPAPVEASHGVVQSRQELTRDHFAKINASEAILVVNPPKNGSNGYIGGAVLMEMAHAFSQGLDIYTLYPVPTDVPYAEEIRGMAPIVLDGNVAKLHDNVSQMPVVLLSSKSPVKHTAVGRGFRQAGLSVRTSGAEVDSGVRPQPMSIDEAYEGAQNRHRRLKESDINGRADYYVTIESGLHRIHEAHNVFGTTVVIVEKRGGVPKIGIDIDIEVPYSFTDNVPSKYPDMGVFV